MPDDAAARENRLRYAVLVASLLFITIGTGSIYFIVVALKLVSAEFDWPRAVPSIAYSVQYFGGGIGGILMGHWADRAGMGWPALVGGTMIGLGAILTSAISEPWHLFFIYGVMMGVFGRSTLFSPLMANITRWFDHKKSMAVGIVGSGQGLAGALWPPIFQYFFGTIGWRQTAIWYGAFVLATLVPLVLILRHRAPVPTPAPAPPVSQGAAPRVPRVLSPLQMQATLCCAAIGCCVAMSLPLAHIAAHVSDLGYDPARGAEILSIMLACATASSFFGVGFLGQRFGGLRAIFVFSTMQALFLGVLAFVDGLASIYLTAALFGIGYGGILPCYPVIVREHLPSAEAGRRTGLVILFAGGGMAIGAWLGGAVFDMTGAYRNAFLIGVGFNLANLAIIGSLIFRTRLRPAPA
ncbi:MAG: MFS transporter [Alphaproteobacteria bacterium]